MLFWMFGDLPDEESSSLSGSLSESDSPGPGPGPGSSSSIIPSSSVHPVPGEQYEDWCARLDDHPGPEPTYRYPLDEFDTAETYLNLRGSPYNDVYRGQHQILAMGRGEVLVARQNRQLLSESKLCLDRFATPPYRRYRWWPVSIKESDRRSDAFPLRYGDGTIYGPASGQPLYRYGSNRNDWVAYPVNSSFDEPVVKIRAVTNRISNPTIFWQHGYDIQFDAKRNLLLFPTDPFLFEEFEITERADERELILWCFSVDADAKYLQQHVHYPVGISPGSSIAARKLSNSVWSAAVRGSTADDVEELVSAAVDAPRSQYEKETVGCIFRDHSYLWVSTDKSVYRGHFAASPRVAPDDEIIKGTALFDTVTFYELNRGELDPQEILGVELGVSFLGGDYHQGISFPNRSVPLLVTSDGIFTKTSFELGGREDDLARFWDEVHSRGLANPPTIAQWLDKRTNPNSEPSPSNLPSTVNPLALLVRSVLRYHTFVVKIKVSHQGPESLGLRWLYLIRKILPPHTACLFILELEGGRESINLSEQGTSTSAGVSETLEFVPALEPFSDAISGTNYISESLRLGKTLSGCTG